MGELIRIIYARNARENSERAAKTNGGRKKGDRARRRRRRGRWRREARSLIRIGGLLIFEKKRNVSGRERVGGPPGRDKRYVQPERWGDYWEGGVVGRWRTAVLVST